MKIKNKQDARKRRHFRIRNKVSGTAARPRMNVYLSRKHFYVQFIDDEASIAKVGKLILEQLGYSVETRTSSLEALELFRSKPASFDLIITDMTMPNMTGDQLALELMNIRPDIPVILCTGFSKKISDDTAPNTCIKAFAYKPVVKADLARTVRKVLDEAECGNRAS